LFVAAQRSGLQNEVSAVRILFELLGFLLKQAGRARRMICRSEVNPVTAAKAGLKLETGTG